MTLAKVWVFAESADGKPVTSTLELCTKARELASTVEAVYVGTDADAVAAALGEYGVSAVHALDPGEGEVDDGTSSAGGTGGAGGFLAASGSNLRVFMAPKYATRASRSFSPRSGCGGMFP